VRDELLALVLVQGVINGLAQGGCEWIRSDNDGAAGAPIIGDGLVWTIGGDNAVHALKPANGKVVVSIPLRDHVSDDRLG
jgi:outer membrane protein assembly factor BamB